MIIKLKIIIPGNFENVYGHLKLFKCVQLVFKMFNQGQECSRLLKNCLGKFENVYGHPKMFKYVQLVSKTFN
ncbi:hypothetical protein QE152_g30263 [Popillia japonica]|uniref:Uncharacterized protein n=1 Tax=Popillia japonica TaxID=7064 RepID=A0AAW1JG61_POPJA